MKLGTPGFQTTVQSAGIVVRAVSVHPLDRNVAIHFARVNAAGAVVDAGHIVLRGARYAAFIATTGTSLGRAMSKACKQAFLDEGASSVTIQQEPEDVPEAAP